MARYNKYRILANTGDYYKALRKRRGLKIIRHYETPILKNPTMAERVNIASDTYIWKYGDRLYKLADRYYNDSRLWWVIAWYNGMPCEAEIKNGALLVIPLDVEEALKALGAV